MDLELHQLERRYEALRARSATRERRVLASIAEIGQQQPIVVVRDGDRFVVVDGYKRLRALDRLGHDTVRAIEWVIGEADALLLERLLRAADADSAVEQGWLLRELTVRFGLGHDELARRFDRTKSWVSRRIGLVAELPESVQAHVRAGAIGSHAAMRYLVPLARANSDDCARLTDAIAPLRPTSRQVASLYALYVGGNVGTRELVLRDPELALRARAAAGDEGKPLPVEQLLEDLRIVGAVARRACRRFDAGAADGADPVDRDLVQQTCGEAHGEVERLKRRCDKEMNDDRRSDPDGDPAPA
ncbi:MAG: ParB N-terminal domain-containing protein [Actinobacteria bacterium]|nr:ParB N-terminal domain-containing protein [Actinomycetota bacterium]